MTTSQPDPGRREHSYEPGAREIFWFDTSQAATYAGRHRDTVEKACASGELHGSQRKKRGRWRIHRDCLDAWIWGASCPIRDRGTPVVPSDLPPERPPCPSTSAGA